VWQQSNERVAGAERGVTAPCEVQRRPALRLLDLGDQIAAGVNETSKRILRQLSP
jgi:hypothetical protein